MRKKKIRIIAAALCALSISFIQVNASQVKLQSNNNRVIASDKSVAVFSSAMRPISSSVLTDALSADGYTIKYVNSKLNQAAVSDVRGGYILAEKNSQSTYIPIVTKSDDIVSEDFFAKDKLIFTEYNNGGSGIVTSLAGGLASKSADDKSYLLAADGSTSAGSNGSYLQYSNPFSADTVYTMEVSVFK